MAAIWINGRESERQQRAAEHDEAQRRRHAELLKLTGTIAEHIERMRQHYQACQKQQREEVEEEVPAQSRDDVSVRRERAFRGQKAELSSAEEQRSKEGRGSARKREQVRSDVAFLPGRRSIGHGKGGTGSLATERREESDREAVPEDIAWTEAEQRQVHDA